ncbi:MAG TPA: LCP family protein [Candidatus Dormibacteraeota bacterium]
MSSQPATGRASMRARRSQYAPRRPWRGALGALLVAGVLIGVVLGGARVVDFLQGVGNLSPATLTKQVDPPAGSIPYKLQHGEQVNLLLLGYGGAENDAPYLTDTLMVVSIDSADHRMMQVSVPRDLMVNIDYGPGKSTFQKINVAYSIGVDDATYPGKRADFKGKDGGGHLAMATVSKLTGLQFDGFVAVDFKAFREVVNALGGVQACLDTPLDDNEYPDYHNGYIKGGIHFPAGCFTVNGEQALEIARSRKAIEPEQATDFGRARRQQMLLNSIRKKATSLNALAKAPQLMDALQKNFVSSLDLSDINALYRFAGKLPDTAIGHFGITQDDLVQRFYMQRGSCADFYADVLCPLDPTFATMRNFFAKLFVDPKVAAEKAPVRVDNASLGVEDLGPRVENVLKPLGFQVEPPVRRRAQTTSYVYDLSGGRYPKTAEWLAGYFGATVEAPPAGMTGDGVVVVLGRDYAMRWLGQ